MKNKIISIGYTGIKKCYLNISEEKAIERYCKSEGLTIREFEDSNMRGIMDIIQFEDEFEAYDVYKSL